ncbi:Phenol 2-monooxygenase [Mycena sanguinolenta]|uniref:Phenol 2-monooxygenase n=1 Tax=Mycena sanguinolenta TaxID=230812 RepID=A0A8H6XZR0_9AGAR|nr:Phenol 2-monooxygenase [Mycena sanguinolenta]
MSPSQASSTFEANFGAPDEVHPVLIAGAGPAGTLLACCLAKLGVRPLIVDSNHFTEHEWGRGDGLICRTIEMFRSLGVGETIVANGSRILERAYWDLTTDPPACKTLVDFFPARLDIEDLYSMGLRQGVIEKILTDATTATCGATVLRPWSVVDVRLDDEDPANKPVIATLQSRYGEKREVRARYVVGCDGGRSTVRRALQKYGVKLEGDAHDSFWTAMDVVGFETDFPDTQKLSIFVSTHGTIMTIPRENINGKNCMRFYCELDRDRAPSVEDAVAIIHEAFHPYKFSWDEIKWYTAYTVGQRIVSSFDVKQRIFLTGDAAHLHSPKGGLGMNTSFLDAHNLAIKIALVETGVAKAEILSTYALERRQVATRLLSLDAQLIQLYADHGKSDNPEDMKKLFNFQTEHRGFQAGTNITYEANCMVDIVPHAPSDMAKLIGAEGLIVGRRLLPASVRRYKDGLTSRILDAVPCDGRFTIFVCFGDLTAPGKVEQLKLLRDSVYRTDGLWARLDKRSTSGATTVLRFCGVTTTSHLSIEAAALIHGGCLGTADSILFDTTSLYCDDVPCLSPYLDHSAATTLSTTAVDILSVKAAAGILLHPVHQKWDIDIALGGIVVVRPDGHVGTLTGGMDADAWLKVERYFERFLVL